jgi:hypothetical protein
MIMETETDVDGNRDGMYLYVDVSESEYIYSILCLTLCVEQFGVVVGMDE